jgi:hypothetical protein
VSAPDLLNADVLHRLMRTFMEYKTDVLPVVERGRIVGQIDRLTLIEALSEIKAEGAYLAMKPAESSEDLLRRLDENHSDGIATVNRQLEFNAVWGRAEILQAQGKIPQVKIWTPPASSTERDTEVTNEDDTPKSIHVAKQIDSPNISDVTSGAPAFTIVRESPPSFSPVTAPAAQPAKAAPPPARNDRAVSEHLHREIERGRLAINTLAALDLPLMACDGAGNEMFHNRAFADIRLREAAHLSSTDLIQRAKDAITESAIKGELDIERAVTLKAGPRGYHVYCKAIRDYDNPTSRAVGYIFWLLAKEPARFTETDAALYTPSAGTADYAGKTLPDILNAEEARVLSWAMREANGNQSDAALLLNIPRQTFNYRYRKLMRASAPRVQRPRDRKNNSEEKTP